MTGPVISPPKMTSLPVPPTTVSLPAPPINVSPVFAGASGSTTASPPKSTLSRLLPVSLSRVLAALQILELAVELDLVARRIDGLHRTIHAVVDAERDARMRLRVVDRVVAAARSGLNQDVVAAGHDRIPIVAETAAGRVVARPAIKRVVADAADHRIRADAAGHVVAAAAAAQRVVARLAVQFRAES